MKHMRLAALLLCILLLPLQALAADAPYYTLTETYDGTLVYSQEGYLPGPAFFEFDGKPLKRPADLFVDEFDRLYIADEGNKRVIVSTLDGELIRVIGSKKEMKSPVGLYARDNKVYVADTKKEMVLVYDVESGEKLFELEHPGTALYGIDSAFKPLKVAVDKAGGMYVISKGNTNGIAQFSADGTFLGYFGANATELSWKEKLKRLTYTKEQREQLKRNIPATPTNLAMDDRGLIYTVTSSVEGVKRLNMAGRNIMEPMSQSLTNIIDLAVGPAETIFTLDETGYLMEYSRDGRMLFYFGGQDGDRTRTGLFVATSAVDVDSQGRLYILDKDKALVQRFEITEYAKLVHQALTLYQEGLYAESRAPWEKVLALNSMFDYAQMGLGRAYYKLERYDEALNAARMGGDKEGYSDSYWEVRNFWLQENILWLIGGLILLIVLRKLWNFFKAKGGVITAISDGLSRVGQWKLLREIRFMTYFPRNPADAFYGVKFEKKVSVLSATILYGLFFLFYMVNKYSCGFLFKGVQDGHYEVGLDLVTVLGGISLFLISCNLICSIREGEGSFKQMYCGMAYALTPYILLKPINFLLTFVLTYNEGFIITLLDIMIIAGCLCMIVMMVKTLQDYSFRQTFAALLLTLFTMLMLVIAMVIAAALVAQLWEFLAGVWKEAQFYHEK